MATNPVETTAMIEAESKPTYLDFEPYCAWHREDERDTLAVHLHGFQKEQMKVQVNNHRILTIYGQRPLVDEDNMWTRFSKQIKLPDDCDENAIHAKLSNGVLALTMPKKLDQLTSSKAHEKNYNSPHGHGETSDKEQKMNDHMVKQEGKESDSSVLGLWAMAGKVAAVVLVLAFSGAYAHSIYKRRSYSADK